MAHHLLYIEDDTIDLLAMKRVLRNINDVELTVCSTLLDIASHDLAKFDFILSDSNLPDGSISDLKKILPLGKTQFISGSEISGEDVWVKPIDLEQIKFVLTKFNIVNMDYINDLADGDDEYVLEMLETALRVLPDRWKELDSAKDDLVLLKKAAHKTKSSYRVCGIENKWLVELEELNEASFKEEHKSILLNQINKQILQAVEELQKLKN
jgi:hypothetical protein